jgi:hypothetical protein
MDRNLSQRIRNVEKLLSKAEEVVSLALKKQEEREEQFAEFIRPKARLHATAVAAIVISGEPKVDEPFTRAWVRTLRHYGITIKNEYGREYEYERGHEHEYKFEDDYERELEKPTANYIQLSCKAGTRPRSLRRYSGLPRSGC